MGTPASLKLHNDCFHAYFDIAIGKTIGVRGGGGCPPPSKIVKFQYSRASDFRAGTYFVLFVCGFGGSLSSIR